MKSEPTVQSPTEPDASTARTRQAYVAFGSSVFGVSVVEIVSLQQTLEAADQVMSSVFTSTWYLTAPDTGFQLNCGSYMVHCAVAPADESMLLVTPSPETVEGQTHVKADPVPPVGDVPTGLPRPSLAVTVQ